jgi:hypothetical protein
MSPIAETIPVMWVSNGGVVVRVEKVLIKRVLSRFTLESTRYGELVDVILSTITLSVP